MVGLWITGTSFSDSWCFIWSLNTSVGRQADNSVKLRKITKDNKVKLRNFTWFYVKSKTDRFKQILRNF